MAQVEYNAHLSLNGNQLLNAVQERLATAPASPVTGRTYFNTTTSKFYGYNGTDWIDLSAVGGDVTKAYVDAANTAQDQTTASLQTQVNTKADLVSGKVPASQLPSYVDDVLEVSTFTALPQPGETGKIYVTLDLNKEYRWGGTAYSELAKNAPLYSTTGQNTDGSLTQKASSDLFNAINGTLSGLYPAGVAFVCLRADGTENFALTNLSDAINWTNAGGAGSITYVCKPCTLPALTTMAAGTILDLQQQPIHLNGSVIRPGNGCLIRNNRLSYGGRYSPDFGAAGDSFTLRGGTFAGRSLFTANPQSTVIFDDVQVVDFGQAALGGVNVGGATDPVNPGRVILRNGASFSAGHQPDPATVVTVEPFGTGTPGRIQPAQLLCVPKQRYLMAPGWNTFVETTGAAGGLITSFWMASYNISQALNTDQILMRVSFDGEAVPSIFGTAGSSIRNFFPAAPAQNKVYTTERFGVSQDNGTAEFSGFLKHPMPFQSGFKIELFNPLSGNIWLWAMMEYQNTLSTFALNPAYRLKGRIARTDALAAYASQTLSSTAVDTVLLGIQHYANANRADHKYMEGDYVISYNGLTGTFHASGLEDFYMGSYYFVSTLETTMRNQGVLLLNQPAGKFLGYRFFDPQEAPHGPTGLQISWTSGDADYSQNGPDGPIQSEVTVWTYELGGQPGVGGGIVDGVAAPNTVATPSLALASGDAQVTASFSSPNATGYVLERSTAAEFAGAVVIYTGAATSFTDTGRTNGQAYYYRVKGTASGFTTSAYATASATPIAANSPWAAGQSVDDDDAGAYTFTGAWQRALDASYFGGAIHYLAPGAAGTAILVRQINCATVTFNSQGGAGDKYDILLDGAVLQTVTVPDGTVNHPPLTVNIPAGNHTFGIRGVAAYNAYATIDRLTFG